MPTNDNVKQQDIGIQLTETRASSRQSTRKAPGTRLGTLQDWRTADNNSAKTLGRHGHTIRDGR
jgi:hypothetical protein